MTINGYWEHWWVEELTPAKARATQYSYRDTYAAYIAPRIDDPHLLIDWRSKLAREKSQSALDHAHRVLSSMLSAATEEGLIPNNPLLLLTQHGRRGRARLVGRTRRKNEPLAMDLTAWFLVLDYLRRATRPRGDGGPPRPRRYSLDRERDALIVAVGFMAGLRLPSEALGLTRADVRAGRLHIEGRSSSRATPYATRHTFISCCLQAGISLATVAQWCGTSIQMISQTYGRMIQRHEGASTVALDEQFRTAKVEAVSLLAAGSRGGGAGAQGGSSERFFDATATQGGSSGGSLGQKVPPPRSRKVAA